MQTRRRGQQARTGLKLLLLAGVLLAVFSLAFAACKSNKKTPQPTATTAAQETPTGEAAACPPQGSATGLTGSGSTFDAPLFTKWNDQYKAQCGVEINYQATGSGAGIKAISDKTVDYGASDAIMNAEQIQASSANGPILHIPVTMGGTAVVVNLPNLTQGQLKLTPDVLAKIFLKQITNWNDPAIAAANAGLALPDLAIAVVHRSDGSGTTFQFTDYLSKISPDWQRQVGSGTTVSWPGDVGAEKNAGVAAGVKGQAGAIGYVEVTYAVQINMIWASIQNKAGKFEEPTLAGITAAAVGMTLPDDMKILIANSDNANAYPISGFSWVLAYVNQPGQAKGQTLVNYLWWAIHQGQSYSEALNYAKLPDGAVAKAEAQIKSIMYNGQPILQAP